MVSQSRIAVALAAFYAQTRCDRNTVKRQKVWAELPTQARSF